VNDFAPEERLQRLGLSLPAPPPALAHYELAVRTGSLLFLAGHARSAVGMQQLHYGMAVEIEGIFEIET
jgi:hypothetical protein